MGYVPVSLKKDVLQVEEIFSLFFCELVPNFFNLGESHDFWELVYVDRGKVIIRADDRRITLSEGEVVFHQPNEFHAIRNAGVTTNIFIISFTCKSPLMNFFRNYSGILPKEAKPLIEQLLRTGAETFDLHAAFPHKRSDAPPDGEQRIRLNLELLLLSVYRPQSEMVLPLSPVSSTDEFSSQIIQWMEEHIYERLSAEDLCLQFHYHKSRLYELFRKSTGTTPLRYFNRLKIEEAKRLILEKRQSFSEISEMLNFDNPLYFSRVFKLYTGISPSAYRESVERYSNQGPNWRKNE